MRIQKNLAQIKIDKSKCNLCGKCIDVCPKKIFEFKNKKIKIGNSDNCIGCLICVRSCPGKAIIVKNRKIKKFFISRTCNNCCTICFENDRNANKEHTTFELFNQFDKEIDGDEEMIVLSGAEITTRKDLFLLLKYIRGKNQKARIFLPTNGRMFYYDSYVKRFIKLKLGDVKITVSILGCNPVVHDRITQVNGSFRQAVQGIKNLIRYKQNVNINVVILKQNYRGVPKICDYFLSIGVNSIQLALVEPNERIKVNFKDFIPRMSECMPYLVSALIKGEGRVKTKNIPACFLKGLYHLKHFSTENHLKEKGEQCQLCDYESECEGIWADYIKIHGASELKPIRKEVTNKSKLMAEGGKTYFFSDYFSNEFVNISFDQNVKETTLITLYEILRNYFNLDSVLLYHHSTMYIDSKTLRKLYSFPSTRIIRISKEIRDLILNLKNKSSIYKNDVLPFFIVLCDIINYKYISKKFDSKRSNYFLYAFSNLNVGFNQFYTNLLIERLGSLNFPKERIDNIKNKLKKISFKSNKKYTSFLNSMKEKRLKNLFLCLNNNEKLHQHRGLHFCFIDRSKKMILEPNEKKRETNILLKNGKVFYV